MRLAGIVTLLLLWGGVAFGASTGNPPAGAFTGPYKLTVRITNTKSAPSYGIYAAQPRCASVCHAVSFRQRRVSEKAWVSTLTYRWNGKAYAASKKFPKSASCQAKSGSMVKEGYDVTVSQKFLTRVVTKERVTRWSGTGKEAYVPNAAGRARHCAAGEYDYTLKAVAH